MPRNITVTFGDGTNHVYQNAPDDITPDMVEARALKEFGKQVISLDGGKGEVKQDTTPQWGKENPNLYSVAQGARKFLGPAVEAGGAILGGLAGAAAGTVASPSVVINPVSGAAIGSGLGYAGAKELTQLADQALGNQAPVGLGNQLKRTAGNVLEGATYEVGGQLISPAISAASKGIAQLSGKVADIGKTSNVKAANMAREALGPDLQVARNLLANAPDGVTAGQAVADINSPTFQALVSNALQRDGRFLKNLKDSQGEVSLNALRNLVGGTTQTEAITAQQLAKNALNDALEPVKNNVLARANMGQDVARFEKQGTQMRGEAAKSVDKVRKMAPLAERTRNSPTYAPEGQPKAPYQYTYKGELAERAENVATKSAKESLDQGTIARANEDVSKVLKDRGINPINTEQITKSLSAKLNDPKLAANPEMEGAVNIVNKEIKKWEAKNGGIIDAKALDAIRKNSINAISAKLNPNADATIQKRIAASVLGNVKPLLVDAIESAGGKGYREYLKAYETGAQAIAQKKLSAEALEMFEKNPKGFVELVKGNSPDKVEKIFGPGSYDIAKEMSQGAMNTLKGVAKTIERDAKVVEQSELGQTAFKELLSKNASTLKFPVGFNVTGRLAKMSIGELQSKIGEKTMGVLTEAAKSGKSMDDLLKTLPANERSKLLKLMNNPDSWARIPKGAKGGTGIAVTNALSPSKENTNNLR